MCDPMRCDSCNGNVTGERVICGGCHDAIVSEASAPKPVPFTLCPDYRQGHPHPASCPNCGGLGAVPADVTPLAEARREAEAALAEYLALPMTVRTGSRLAPALRDLLAATASATLNPPPEGKEEK